MFKIQNILKAFALLVTFCTCLAAQGVKVAVAEPLRPETELKLHAENVVQVFADVITKHPRYILVNRDTRTGGKLDEELDIVKNPSLTKITDSDAIKLEKRFGTRFLLIPRLSRNEAQIVISCQVVDIETRRVYSSESRRINDVTDEEVVDAAKKVITELLVALDKILDGEVNIEELRGKLNFSGIVRNLKLTFENAKHSAKWDDLKKSLVVDLEELNIIVDSEAYRKNNRILYRVNGWITLKLGSQAELNIELPEEMAVFDGGELSRRIRNEIINPKIQNIIGEMLSQTK